MPLDTLLQYKTNAKEQHYSEQQIPSSQQTVHLMMAS
jgi:hypothetical protein